VHTCYDVICISRLRPYFSPGHPAHPLGSPPDRRSPAHRPGAVLPRPTRPDLGNANSRNLVCPSGSVLLLVLRSRGVKLAAIARDDLHHRVAAVPVGDVERRPQLVAVTHATERIGLGPRLAKRLGDAARQALAKMTPAQNDPQQRNGSTAGAQRGPTIRTRPGREHSGSTTGAQRGPTIRTRPGREHNGSTTGAQRGPTIPSRPGRTPAY